MATDNSFSRRVLLARAAGMTLTLGAPGILRSLSSAYGQQDPYETGIWLAGDHHIHTKFSPDGEYEIEKQVENAVRYGLNWCVITDHGGPKHDRVALTQAYSDLMAARKKNTEIMVFQGLEWNIPSAEHGSVILPPTSEEAQRISEFEALYDEKNLSRANVSHKTEADAVAGIKYLQSLTLKPLFMANHPARRGLNSPHEMRAWSDAGPDVARGFEGAPGHAACTLVGMLRGEYNKTPSKDSWPGYPLESYRTWGGYDWYVAKVGGVWDSLLGEGRPWYITVNSDSHRHFDDRQELDETTYNTKGYVTATGGTVDKAAEGDFYPGEYAKTWVYAEKQNPLAVMEALRNGSMFTVLGDLVDRVELTAVGTTASAGMGATLALDKSGEDVDVFIRVRTPETYNFNRQRPKFHHIDLIAGDITGPSSDADSMTNPTTKVVAQFKHKAERDGLYYSFRYRFANVGKSFYLRVRGTNTQVDAPSLDSPSVNPWDDLWFYSNPIFVKV